MLEIMKLAPIFPVSWLAGTDKWRNQFKPHPAPPCLLFLLSVSFLSRRPPHIICFNLFVLFIVTIERESFILNQSYCLIYHIVHAAVLLITCEMRYI